MLVLCCHTDLRPETRAALDLHAAGHELGYVDCNGDESRYRRALADAWSAGDGLANVEHDIVIDDTVLPSFTACRWPWCVYVYELAVGFPPGVLGCARFSADLVRAEPDAIDHAARDDSSGVPAGAWYRLDVRVDRLLRDRGYRPHIHGRLLHLNERQRLADPDAGYHASLLRHMTRRRFLAA